jgi:hypothetical protein
MATQKQLALKLFHRLVNLEIEQLAMSSVLDSRITPQNLNLNLGVQRCAVCGSTKSFGI